MRENNLRLFDRFHFQYTNGFIMSLLVKLGVARETHIYVCIQNINLIFLRSFGGENMPILLSDCTILYFKMIKCG